MTKKLIPTERMRDQLMMQSKAKGGSVIKQLEDYLRERKGEYGVKRLQRAADEIPGLENMYTLDALRSAFLGDNAKALMTMPTRNFERYAVPLSKSSGVKLEFVEGLPEMTRDEYIKYLSKVKGFADVPYLEIGQRVKTESPYIAGHEGRHRMRALKQSGKPSSLVVLHPRYELREDFPRRSQEEYINALKQTIGKKPVVSPELAKSANPEVRPNIELPDIYAKGGNVDRMRDHMMVRGFAIGGWHGSPHDIPMGRSMKMEKIGTGEGAQAYGHGLYVAEDKNVGKGYRNAGWKSFKIDGEVVIPSMLQGVPKELAAAALSRFSDKKQAIDWIGNSFPDCGKKAKQIIKKAKTWGENEGSLYKLELSHPDPAKEKATPLSPNDFLHWDKPLSQQPESVRKIAQEHGVKDMVNIAEDPQNGFLMSPSLGADVYENLVNKLGKEGASLALNKIGIPGIRYLDAGSRGKGKGTHNYVIFDPSLINIVGKEAKGGSIHPSIDTMKLALIMKASGGGVSLPGFFSPVDQALDTVQNKGTGQQILSQLSKAPNVKPDELKDRGIDAALRARPKITKEELKDMAKAMSAPRIKEIHRHGPSGKKFTIEQSPYGGFEVLDEYSEPVKKFGDYYDAQDHADKLMHGDSKYEEYQLPGGKNYRETTLSLDTGKKRPSTKIWEVMDETGRVFSQTDNPQTAERWKHTYPNRVREKDIASSLDKPPQGMFVSGHWDEPNVLLHYRTNDRTDANGKKVLFIEELQSDLAKAIRKHSSEKESDSNPPPELPFTTSTEKWLNLALKHIIHRAAKEGYDKVAFINGEQSHKRFPQKKNGSSSRGAFSSFYGEPTGEVVNDIEEPQKGKSPMLHTALNKLLPKIKGGKLSHVMLPDIHEAETHSPQVGFDITPEMREHIKTKGLPLYHSGGLI